MKSVQSTRANAFGFWRALSSLGFVVLVACNQRPSDLREWRVSDHDQSDNPNAAAAQGQVDPTASAGPAIPGLEDVTIVAWQQNCITCHGQLGRGDGPRGPMVKATNLSDPAWQAAITDEQIARTIKEGKGAMPPFKLPDGTIANLVKLVRMMNAARLGAHGGPAAPSAAASASAAPASPAASGAVKPAPGASSTAKPPAATSTPKPQPTQPTQAPAAPAQVPTPTAP